MYFFSFKIFKRWPEFYLNLTSEKYGYESLKAKSLKFFKLIRIAFEPEDVNPYLHILVAHLHEFKMIHGSVNNFNQQGLEKLNDRTTMEYFRATNKNKYAWRRANENGDERTIFDETYTIHENFDKIWLIQILELRNRNDEAMIKQEILIQGKRANRRQRIMNEYDEAIIRDNLMDSSDEEEENEIGEENEMDH